MSYGIWESYKDFSVLHDHTNEQFRDFLFQCQDGSSSMEGIWIPPVDICDQDDSFVLVADLPGVKQENIHIHAEKDRLVLFGARSTDNEISNESYHRIELVYGKFWRAFSLNCGIDKEKIKAKLCDGVLTIVLPKNAGDKRTEIKVR